MKFHQLSFALLFLVLFSCSSDDNSSNQDSLPDQGSISLALSNGAGFPVEDISGIISNLYNDTINTADIFISGTAGATGSITINVIDDDSSFRALVNENAFPVGDPTLSIFAAIDYSSDNFNLNAGAGTLEILNYEEFPEQGYALLSATFSVSDANFNTMTSSMFDIVLVCQNC